MKDKIMEVGERLYNMAEHNEITNFQQWNEKMFELLGEAFPERERVGDLCEEVDEYLHNKYSFGFCDLCGCYINYESDQWYDTGLFEPEQNEWLEKSLPLWEKFYGDTAVCEYITDLCPICYHDLTTEEGFRAVPLTECDLVAKGTGGKSHTNETMGEFLDEAGLDADCDPLDISYTLLVCGFYPLDGYMPFIGDEEKMRDFKELDKRRFLESYSYLTETEYDITKKLVENNYE